MKVGIFGGSFDPVHLGHLWVAQGCGEQLGLDQVIFIPAATSPLKPGGAVASAAQRVMMLQLALSGAGEGAGGGDLATAGEIALLVDQRELRRGGASYTVETVTELQQQRPGDEFLLLVGSDAFASIGDWHRPAELLAAIMPVVFRRGGDPPLDWTVLDGLVSPQRAAEIRQCAVTLPMIELSSSELRRRVANRQSIRYRVPHSVAAYIQAQSLYRSG
jgi:nicotinate-nucleotide adenylyltransferase